MKWDVSRSLKCLALPLGSSQLARVSLASLSKLICMMNNRVALERMLMTKEKDTPLDVLSESY